MSFMESRKHKKRNKWCYQGESAKNKKYFDGKWFRGIDDFYKIASINGTGLTALQEDMYGFVIE